MDNFFYDDDDDYNDDDDDYAQAGTDCILINI